jgi:hypothetical protein
MLKPFIMKKLSLKKMSFLGLVLVAASALTAAILPSKENKKGPGASGQLIPDTQAGEVTCKIDSANACTITFSTGTTLNSPNSSVDSIISTGEVNTTIGHS